MNVYIHKPVNYNDMQGPAPSGFHIPLTTEWQGLKTIMDGLGLTTGDSWRINLHMTFAGYRRPSSADLNEQGSSGHYWSSSPYGYNNPNSASSLYLSSSFMNTNVNDYRSFVYSIRCFKNSFELPASSWTVITGTLGSAGIFWNQTEGLISITSDGVTGYTIIDKNLGATTVYNDGDTLTQANMGNMYQWGNNYGFPSTGSVSQTSSTQVDASSYGPGNYYSSSTFITRSSSPYDWSSVQNDNLRGGETGVGGQFELKNVYIGEKPYDTESIVYKMNANSNGYLYIPLAGFSTGGGQDCPYSWKISIDGGAETTYTGTGSSGGVISLSGYTPGTNHTIRIMPTSEGYGRARAFSFYGTVGATLLTEVLYDGSYMGYASSDTITGINFRTYQYRGCSSLTNAPEEYLPNTVTTISQNFRYGQFENCTSLTTAPEEVLPNSVTSIEISFRQCQFKGCTSLNNIKGWKDSSLGAGYYRYQQFMNCTANKTIKVLSDVGYASYDSSTLADVYVTSISVPSAYLSAFKSSTKNPWVNIIDSKFVGY